MHLFVLITGIVLFPKVNALECNECIGHGTNKCISTERECPAKADRCFASRVTTYAGNTKEVEINSAGCLRASDCIEGSLNTGKQRTVLNSKCCTTDLCNDQPPPEPAAPRPNGKKCMGCDGTGGCWNVKCVDNEDHCFSTTVGDHQNMTLKGCISKNYCLRTGVAELLNLISAEMICCQGDDCNSAGGNSAGSAGGSLLLLVVTMVSLVIFS